ncbi:hypothetical protein [Micromonospora sp. NBC_01813]|uniref:hypothetical protein n=1 Tax=Micromonospora sp. NBC_01813 TaxID=2975988 RepID=UPI002DD8E26F|nr:hypothetical protein [Micromonospora sp. NBC_01813]WSA11932.1 hypothetical protein OG958_14765 [Micromonospora sp. NBC_01813]
MAELTDDERDTLKTGAFGAVYLVSNADPGLFSMVKESFAASDAFAGATGLVKNVLTTGGLPKLPRDTPEAVEALVLPALRRSVAILTAKSPHDLEHYRATVAGAADRVAGAASGVDAAESAIIVKIKQALAAPS